MQLSLKGLSSSLVFLNPLVPLGLKPLNLYQSWLWGPSQQHHRNRWPAYKSLHLSFSLVYFTGWECQHLALRLSPCESESTQPSLSLVNIWTRTLVSHIYRLVLTVIIGVYRVLCLLCQVFVCLCLFFFFLVCGVKCRVFVSFLLLSCVSCLFFFFLSLSFFLSSSLALLALFLSYCLSLWKAFLDISGKIVKTM